MRSNVFISSLVAMVFSAIQLMPACQPAAKKSAETLFRERLPVYIEDSIYLWHGNPFSAEKAALGRYLFYDRRLSVNNTKSCASCHDPRFSFTDGYRRSIGALGDNTQHNAPALINIVFNPYLTRADSNFHFPEQQVNNPMFHDQPAELGWKGHTSDIIGRLKKDHLYIKGMDKLFPSDPDPINIRNIQFCIASFVKTIIALQSPYDKYAYTKDSTALSVQATRGMRLFFSERLHCGNCHGGINFSTPGIMEKNGQPAYYQNTGLYNTDGQGAYPLADQGLIGITHQSTDMGKFRVAGLRNLEYTAPYLHDGSAPDLSTVIDIYARGGRHIRDGLNQGDGKLNPYKNKLISGFSLSAEEKKDLIQFLLSLTDAHLLHNAAYNNPFGYDETRP